MKGVPGLVRTGQHGPGGVARGVAGLNPINIKQEPSGGAVQEAPGVYLLCTTIDWRNDFWVCPFPIKRSTTPSKFSVLLMPPQLELGQHV